MVGYFEPLLKLQSYEKREEFVNETDTRSVVANVFISVALMLLAMVITLTYIWAYRKDVSLFIAIFALVVFLFTVEMVIFVTMVRSNVSRLMFMTFMGSVVFMAFMAIVLIIFFSIQASRGSGSGSGSYSRSSYSSPAVTPSYGQDYGESSNV